MLDDLGQLVLRPLQQRATSKRPKPQATFRGGETCDLCLTYCSFHFLPLSERWDRRATADYADCPPLADCNNEYGYENATSAPSDVGLGESWTGKV